MNAYQIEISNEQDCLDVDEDFLMEVVRRTLQAEQAAAAEISVALLNDESIHELNRRYLGHDYPTDVLSFLLACEAAGADEESSEAADDQADKQSERPPAPQPRGAGKRLEGEILISTETAVEESRKYHWSPHEEVVLYLVHGLLHLCGYDDQTQSERELMRSREQAILSLWNLIPHYSETADPSAVDPRSQSAGGNSGAET